MFECLTLTLTHIQIERVQTPCIQIKPSIGRNISWFQSPCFVPLSPQRASILVCSHLQRNTRKTRSKWAEEKLEKVNGSTQEKVDSTAETQMGTLTFPSLYLSLTQVILPRWYNNHSICMYLSSSHMSYHQQSQTPSREREWGFLYTEFRPAWTCPVSGNRMPEKQELKFSMLL